MCNVIESVIQRTTLYHSQYDRDAEMLIRMVIAEISEDRQFLYKTNWFSPSVLIAACDRELRLLIDAMRDVNFHQSNLLITCLSSRSNKKKTLLLEY